MRRSLRTGIAAVALCACGRDVGGGDVASTEGAVSEGAQGFAVAAGLTGAMRDAQRATAVVRGPLRAFDGSLRKGPDGTAIVSTCGTTFVDRHHAVTAAHCVSSDDIPDPTTRLTLQFIDVDETTNWREAAKLTGIFPHYTHPPVAGTYRVTESTCTVAVRCKSFDSSPLNCPAAATGADVAVLDCDPGLPDDRAPVGIAAEEPEPDAVVQAFWFHEVYDVPLQRPTSASGADLFDHYTAFDDDYEQNYHYFDGRNQVLPLISVPFASGEPRRRTGSPPDDPTAFWTDILSCHGTSGSGIMHLGPSGRYELLGPAIGETSLGNGVLCLDPAKVLPGTLALSYTMSSFTRAAVAAAQALHHE
jgi:hypothetical protein